MKVSVIIPVYNVERYLPRCIASVLMQTYRDLEIILVDDGSSDASAALCDAYAAGDERITVIHQENGGLSAARNAGIERASGDAFFFLDSDDYIAADCMEKLVSLLERHDADVSVIRMKRVPESENGTCAQSADEEELVMNAERAIEESLYQKRFSCCAPAKLYRRHALGAIRFPVGRGSEDLATCHLFLNNARSIVYTSYPGYYYRQREGSVMHAFHPGRLDALEWAEAIEAFCREAYPGIRRAAACRTFNVAVHLVLDMPDCSALYPRYSPVLWHAIRRTRANVLLDPKSRGREKAAALLSFGGERVLKAAWRSGLAVRRACT